MRVGLAWLLGDSRGAQQSRLHPQCVCLEIAFASRVFTSKKKHIRCSIVVSISACHAEDLGSIPGGGDSSTLAAHYKLHSTSVGAHASPLSERHCGVPRNWARGSELLQARESPRFVRAGKLATSARAGRGWGAVPPRQAQAPRHLGPRCPTARLRSFSSRAPSGHRKPPRRRLARGRVRATRESGRGGGRQDSTQVPHSQKPQRFGVARGYRCWYQATHGLLWELNPGPLTPEARIMPLDQAAMIFYALA